ncbi:uncharacterized protein B0P05DRAFT_538743 [Gilbertella persicaria]|uniref:uncharacterized protein n=1 Tax=Gilbertella persicaria TaxID=101096 RepID=UPI00221E51F2|nr:uncharacterized protein B0P05DRAFT_538743 [Gilbertella persicaria]KAI8081946.1 hypothetical protein B0P05DRAFT_538743 [Gilbertella persicaria]
MFIKSITSRTASRMTKRFTAYQTGSEGATAQSGSFGQKEKAIENQWARAHDAEKLKILREALAKQEKETAHLKKNIEDLAKKHTS